MELFFHHGNLTGNRPVVPDVVYVQLIIFHLILSSVTRLQFLSVGNIKNTMKNNKILFYNLAKLDLDLHYKCSKSVHVGKQWNITFQTTDLTY